MNLSPKFLFVSLPGRSGPRGGFTLVEMLVAITILAIMVLLFGQMLGVMSKAWVYGHNRANNFTKARAMLDLLARDFQSGIFRPDLAAFPTSGTLEFYTLRPGIPPSAATGSVRYASLVQYAMNTGTNSSGMPTSTLERSDAPVMWTDPASYLAFGSTTSFTSTAAGGSPTLTQRDTAPGVITFQIVFLQAPSTSGGTSFSTTLFTPLLSSSGVANANPTRAVGITLAVVDDQTMLKMSSKNLSDLNSALTNAVATPPLHNIKAYWDTYLNGTSMQWNSYPKSLGTGLATFERYVTLPTTP